MTLSGLVVIVTFMEVGNIVEYIDGQKIMCAVVIEIKKQRLRLLTENNREVNFSAGRLLHCDANCLDLTRGRDQTVDSLKKLVDKRLSLTNRVDVKDLWEVLNTEQEWIDLQTMTAFCFTDSPCSDHESAVLRKFFSDRLYFKFNPDRFFPNSEEQVERIMAQQREQVRKNEIIEKGGDWLNRVLNGSNAVSAEVSDTEISEYLEILKSFYLVEKESKDHALARAIMARAKVDRDRNLFPLFVKHGVFSEDENLDLLGNDVNVEFPEAVLQRTDKVLQSPLAPDVGGSRKDLTKLHILTIDGQSTLDFDDALSLETFDDYYRLGIHIVDVGHFVKKGDAIDQEAVVRGSSVYMPDQKISMLPSSLSEDLCSLKAGEMRPAISTLVKLSPNFQILDYEIMASLVRVDQQLTYYDVNLMADENKDMATLRGIGQAFRRSRLDDGAVQITVPEVNIWISDDKEINVNKINRESPGRMLVSEIMILANWLMARFLADHNAPAIFRSQPAPRQRLYNGDEGTLFQNWMQRRLLSRFILNHSPEKHSGLGLNAYVTATSPIRKYFDLVTQRQIRAILGLEDPYSANQIDQIIQQLELPMSRVGKLQYRRNRYWLLKYLEKKIGQKEEAIVLTKRRNNYQILLSKYMIECELPISGGLELKPEDLIQVTVQHVSARQDILKVFIG